MQLTVLRREILSISVAALWLRLHSPLLHMGQLLLARQQPRTGADALSLLLHTTRTLPCTALDLLAALPGPNTHLQSSAQHIFHLHHPSGPHLPHSHNGPRDCALLGDKATCGEDGVRLGCSYVPKSLGPAGLINPNKQCLEDTWTR